MLCNTVFQPTTGSQYAIRFTDHFNKLMLIKIAVKPPPKSRAGNGDKKKEKF